MSKLSTGLLIAVLVMASIYAGASAIAANIVASYTRSETAKSTRAAERASAVQRASTEQKASRSKCKILTGTEKNLCHAQAMPQQKRYKMEARLKHKNSSQPLNEDDVDESEIAGDVVMYRARQ